MPKNNALNTNSIIFQPVFSRKYTPFHPVIPVPDSTPSGNQQNLNLSRHPHIKNTSQTKRYPIKTPKPSPFDPNPPNPNPNPVEMDGAGGGYTPRTPEEVFQDFRGRRAAIVKALTEEVAKFFELCDPEKDNLCLYANPNETWEVNLPAEEVPPELPEPALGINFARDGMSESDWLSLVAIHSDSWLMSVAFYFGARFGFDRDARRRLFTMINNLPTIFEVVNGAAAKKQSKEKTPNSSSKSSKSNTKLVVETQTKSSGMLRPKDESENENGDEESGEEDGEEHGTTPCGACGGSDGIDEFWICCDVCERWFHGKCVKITPARAEHIKQYKCPSCSNKRARG